MSFEASQAIQVPKRILRPISPSPRKLPSSRADPFSQKALDKENESPIGDGQRMEGYFKRTACFGKGKEKEPEREALKDLSNVTHAGLNLQKKRIRDFRFTFYNPK